MKQTPLPLHADSAVIDALGGASAVARMLGLATHGVQRVHNWRARGIPWKVKAEHPDLFLKQSKRG